MIFRLKEFVSCNFYLVYRVPEDRETISFLRNVTIPPRNRTAKIVVLPPSTATSGS